MSGVNLVALLGKLGADPELQHTRNGQPVMSMRLGVPTYYTNNVGKRVERIGWHIVVVWGPRAVELSKFLKQGMLMLVKGRLDSSIYEDHAGKKRYKTEIVASSVTVFGKVVEGGAAVSTDAPGVSPGGGAKDEEEEP